MANKKKKVIELKVRNPYVLLQHRGEIDLNTRSESTKKAKYSRKTKHTKRYT